MGTFIGFAAASALALEAGEASSASSSFAEPAVTLAGDAAALLGALAMGIYLGVGGSLRQWMPLWMYAFPVTLTAAVAAGVFSLALERDVTLTGTGPSALFGWLGSGQRALVNLAAALGSGICGHTLANFALQRVNPLAVSVALLLEPVVGSVLGFAAGVQGLPGPVTLGSGPFLMLGALLTTLGARKGGASGQGDGGGPERWWQSWRGVAQRLSCLRS